MDISLIPAIVWSSILTAMSCSILGSFLVLRRLSMVGAALSHSMLPGLVLGLLVLGHMGSPQLVLGPAIVAFAMVVAIEALSRTGILAGDSPLGIIYPVLFSVGIILVSNRFAGIPITESSVLIGDINFAAATPIYFGDILLGPRPLVVMGVIFLLNITFVFTFFKELAITTFDPVLARTSGFRPVVLHYALMVLVSVTIVGAFEAVGAVLVVALLIAPPASAYLLTRRLHVMVVLSAGIGAVSALAGFQLAYLTDSATSGTMAMVAGMVFLLTFVAAPRRGLVSKALQHRYNRRHFAEQMLMLCLAHHAGGQDIPAAQYSPEHCETDNVDALAGHIGWNREFTNDVVKRCISKRYLSHHHGVFVLTPAGRNRVERLADKIELQRATSRGRPEG